MNQLDPYQAPQAELQGEPDQGGSLLKAVLIGLAACEVMSIAIGGGTMAMAIAKASIVDHDVLQWLITGLNVVASFLGFYLTGRIGRGKEWQAGAIVFLLKMAINIGLSVGVAHMRLNFTPAFALSLLLLVTAAVAGTWAATAYNRKL